MSKTREPGWKTVSTSELMLERHLRGRRLTRSLLRMRSTANARSSADNVPGPARGVSPTNATVLGEPLHVDVKKRVKIPPRGRRVHGRSEAVKGRGIGFGHVHVVVDDHSQLAYVEVVPDEKGPSCAGFLANAAVLMASSRAPAQELKIDKTPTYVRSVDVAKAAADLSGRNRRTKSRSRWLNGKVEQFNRTLHESWALQRMPTTSATTGLEPCAAGQTFTTSEEITALRSTTHQPI